MRNRTQTIKYPDKENNFAKDKARLNTEVKDLSITKGSLEVRACPETILSSSFRENSRDVIRIQQPASFVICNNNSNTVPNRKIQMFWYVVLENEYE